MDALKGASKFDTNVFFSGGAGMFIQYHDLVRPVYLMAIIKMLLGGPTFGLPIEVLRSMPIESLIEWYVNRRYINPIKCLDFKNLLTTEDAADIMKKILDADPSIYTMAPTMNIHRLLYAYSKQHMGFPVYIYTREFEDGVKRDCEGLFPGITAKYLYGDLRRCIEKCDQNFTYMISDVDLLPEMAAILVGNCSSVIVAHNYRYNFKPKSKEFKHSLEEIETRFPFIRIDTNTVFTPDDLLQQLKELSDNAERKESM